MKVFVIFAIAVFAMTSYLISGADARCITGYPCRSPASPPISAEMAFRSDTIVLGIPVQKYHGVDVLAGYDKNNPSNPCGLGLQYVQPNQGIVDFLNNSTHKAPFLYEFKVDKTYKNQDTNDIIQIIGIERIHDRHYAEQMSYGYKFTPEIGETLLLYLRHFDEFSFGTNCKISDVYLVETIQSCIWEWNSDDNVPDIYPGDVKIPTLKEQRAFQSFEEDKTISPAVSDLIACKLGMEPMYRLYLGSPFCVTSDTADEIEQRGWAKRFSFFWTFDGLQYKHTENYEFWRK